MPGLVLSKLEMLVLWATSEIIGSALIFENAINPKHEIRNPKQYLVTKIPMIQTRKVPGIAMMVFVFVIRKFDI